MKGYVYIISNRSMPGIYKVGYTLKDPELRAKELESTGVPHPFVVDYEILVDDPYTLEQKIHKSLSKFNENKEWFNCDFLLCIATIKKCYDGHIYYERCIRDEKILKLKKEKEKKHAAEQAQQVESKRNREIERIKIKYADKEKAYLRVYFIKSICVFLVISILAIFLTFHPERDIPLDIILLFIIGSIIASWTINYFERGKIKDIFWKRNIDDFQNEIKNITIDSQHVEEEICYKEENLNKKDNNDKIIQCPECGQNLRVGFAKLIRVHCPKCDTLFYWKNS